MIPSIRKDYNANFSSNKYKAFLQEFENKYPNTLGFRVAETPVFVDKEFTNKMLHTCESIVDVITGFNFKTLTSHGIPNNVRVPNENNYSHFIAFDFGVCKNEDGTLKPQLIEMQGFPTLFAYQTFLDKAYRAHFNIPQNYSAYLNNYTEESYLQLLKNIIIGNHNSENVVLLEVFPHEQKTKIDFFCTQDYLGINIVCITELIKEGKKLYYKKDNRKIEIKRIYNRLIFDDLQQQSAQVQDKGKILLEELDVEWVPHPNWFYRISKYTLPYINNPYVPKTTFLNDIKEIPKDLENYVLKPLFSFAGQGVFIDVTKKDIENITDPHNWILQRKVNYAEIIETPDIPAKAEIRIFYFWEKGKERPVATLNLARLSKGKMIGVRYNENKEWVGGTIAYFEK
ncbi:MAG: hypothetical protein LC122_15170 [Chitinophagales bacterium]|nr:hypothetical protein [Chitinophagales bacterium]